MAAATSSSAWPRINVRWRLSGCFGTRVPIGRWLGPYILGGAHRIFSQVLRRLSPPTQGGENLSKVVQAVAPANSSGFSTDEVPEELYTKYDIPHNTNHLPISLYKTRSGSSSLDQHKEVRRWPQMGL